MKTEAEVKEFIFAIPSRSIRKKCFVNEKLGDEPWKRFCEVYLSYSAKKTIERFSEFGFRIYRKRLDIGTYWNERIATIMRMEVAMQEGDE